MTDALVPRTLAADPLQDRASDGKPLKVLISAYHCAPNRGSEHAAGWIWVENAARDHEVWIFTSLQSDKDAVLRYLEAHPMPNTHWHFIVLPKWLTFWRRGERGRRLYYYLWQIWVYFLARRMHRTIGFDIVHHATNGTYWQPSLLAALPVPFIWGPVGGGESMPRSFYKSFSRRKRLFEYARDLGRKRSEWDPLVRLTARRAARTFVTSDETLKRVRRLGAKHPEVLSQVGLTVEEFERFSAVALHETGPFRLISIGRLLHWKGFQFALMAFQTFLKTHPDAEYWILGDGPYQQALEDLARELNISGSVRFTGRVPRDEVLTRLSECDVLVHPSLHEAGGWICSEAMAARRPVICLDLGGPALQVTRETGIKVPAVNPTQTIKDLALAMEHLAGDADLRQRMGEAGQKRVKELFVNDVRGEFMSGVYQELTSKVKA